jgi:hypothetical protein
MRAFGRHPASVPRQPSLVAFAMTASFARYGSGKPFVDIARRNRSG